MEGLAVQTVGQNRFEEVALAIIGLLGWTGKVRHGSRQPAILPPRAFVARTVATFVAKAEHVLSD
jgi:hypothetical protein